MKPLMRDKDALFKGSKAKEYDLFTKAVPHHENFQYTVGQLVNSSTICPAAASGKKVTLAEGGIGTGCTLREVVIGASAFGLATVFPNNRFPLPSALKFAKSRGLPGVERIYAVDASPAMIDICKRDFDIPQLEFVTAGLRSFFEASAQLDGVYSAYTIHNMAQEDQVTIFKAIYARLRPGGCFVDGDLLAYSDPELQRITFQWQQEMVRKELPHDLAEQWIDHYNQDTPRYFTVEQLLSILSSIGFDAKLEYREKLEAVILARKP